MKIKIIFGLLLLLSHEIALAYDRVDAELNAERRAINREERMEKRILRQAIRAGDPYVAEQAEREIQRDEMIKRNINEIEINRYLNRGYEFNRPSDSHHNGYRYNR
ncbi:MAG: hypothetical protein WAX77_13430 [Methylococcaceae bacterium]